MRRNINGTCSPSCCKNPNIRTINTMDADTQGNFEIRAGAGVGITTETNGIRISYTGGLIAYTNNDGNLDIDNVNFTIDLANDIVIAGDLTVNGTYYTVHAEHVYTEDDYIIMRDGAVTGLGSGQYSGFQVKLYDGVNDGRLVIDNSGTARVGDVGSEQPLLTRAEVGSLTNGQSLVWDSGNVKAITQAIPADISVALAGKQATLAYTSSSTTINGCVVRIETYGKVIVVSSQGGTPTNTGDFEIASGITNNPFGLVPIISGNDSINPIKGYLYGLSGKLYMRFSASGSIDTGFRFVGLLS